MDSTLWKAPQSISSFLLSLSEGGMMTSENLRHIHFFGIRERERKGWMFLKTG